MRFLILTIIGAFLGLFTTLTASDITNFVEFKNVLNNSNDINQCKNQYNLFYDFWLNANKNQKEDLEKSDDLYIFCIEKLKCFNWQNYKMTIEESKSLSISEKRSIAKLGIMMNIVAIGYLSGNKMAVDYATFLAANQKTSGSEDKVFNLWTEIVKELQKAQEATQVKHIAKNQDAVNYLYDIFTEKQYINDKKAQYFLNYIVGEKDFFVNNRIDERKKKEIINLLEIQFDELKENKNSRDSDWQPQYIFIELHSKLAPLQITKKWFLEILQTKKISGSSKRFILNWLKDKELEIEETRIPNAREKE